LLPDGVFAVVTETMDGSFAAIAAPDNGKVVISWEFVPRIPSPLPPGTQGMFPEPATQAPPPPRPFGETPNSGVLQLNVQTGALLSTEPGLLVPPPELLRGDGEAESTGNPNETVSADGRYVLVSEKTKDSGELYKYHLSVWERSTGRRLGGFQSFSSTVPFFVVGSRVIYETPSYSERVGERMVTQQRKLHAADLDSGRELWSVAVRDDTYQGPFPP